MQYIWQVQRQQTAEQRPAGSRSMNSTAALALEFVVLAAARCGEAVGARWEEFDLENAMWTVPVSTYESRTRAPSAAVTASAYYH